MTAHLVPLALKLSFDPGCSIDSVAECVQCCVHNIPCAASIVGTRDLFLLLTCWLLVCNCIFSTESAHLLVVCSGS